jgi:exosortase
MYIAGFNMGIQSLWHAGAVAVVTGCALSVLGKNVLFRFMPAFAVLVFLIPVPGTVRQSIAVPLQTATAATTQAIFETLAVPVERSGNVLIINGTEVAVAEACNGMRMVFALVLVSYAFAYSMPLRNSVRILVLLASPVAAIACNVVRLIPTIWLYGFSSSGVADWFHDISGWVMLPVGFFMLLGIIRLLRWALIPVARFNLAYQ